MFQSIHHGEKSDTLEEGFDQYVTTSFDEYDTLNLQLTHTIPIKEEQTEHNNLATSKSMLEIVVPNGSGLKPILRRSSYGERSSTMFRKSHSAPSFLSSVSECTMEEPGNTESLHSTTNTCTSTVASDCSIACTISSPTIGFQEAQVQLNDTIPKIRHNVSFHSVEIREYEITLVDNPACRNGPPIGLSWNYQQEDAHNFYVYESTRIFNRRTGMQMIIPKKCRKEMLKGHCKHDIRQVKKEMKKIKSSRTNSILFYGLFEVKECLESASKSIKRKLRKNKAYDKDWSSSHI